MVKRYVSPLSPSSIALQKEQDLKILQEVRRAEVNEGGSYVSFVETDGDAALFLTFCCHCVVMAVVDVVVDGRGERKVRDRIGFRRCWRRICVGHVLWSMLSEAWRSSPRPDPSDSSIMLHRFLHLRFKTLNDPYHNDRYQHDYKLLFQSFHTCNKAFFQIFVSFLDHDQRIQIWLS
jgi:hypothetical protein